MVRRVPWRRTVLGPAEVQGLLSRKVVQSARASVYDCSILIEFNHWDAKRCLDIVARAVEGSRER